MDNNLSSTEACRPKERHKHEVISQGGNKVGKIYSVDGKFIYLRDYSKKFDYKLIMTASPRLAIIKIKNFKYPEKKYNDKNAMGI